jgi:hypothetical protein
MTFTTKLYERDEQGKFWPAGSVVWSSRKRAIQSLEFHVCDGIAGIVVADGAYIAAFKGMTAAEAYRVSPVKIFGCAH